MLLFALAGCFDAATTTLFLDVRTGEAHVVQLMHNAWPDEVGCSDAADHAKCVDGVRAYLAKATTALMDGGATVARAGVLLDAGKLDLLYDYTTLAGTKALSDQGITLLWMDLRTSSQVAAGRSGRQELALLKGPTGNGTESIAVEGRYTLHSGLMGETPVSLYVFSGKKVKITSEWTYVPGDEGRVGPGAWVADRPGLAEALSAAGLLVQP